MAKEYQFIKKESNEMGSGFDNFDNFFILFIHQETE